VVKEYLQSYLTFYKIQSQVDLNTIINKQIQLMLNNVRQCANQAAFKYVSDDLNIKQYTKQHQKFFIYCVLQFLQTINKNVVSHTEYILEQCNFVLSTPPITVVPHLTTTIYVGHQTQINVSKLEQIVEKLTMCKKMSYGIIHQMLQIDQPFKFLPVYDFEAYDNKYMYVQQLHSEKISVIMEHLDHKLSSKKLKLILPPKLQKFKQKIRVTDHSLVTDLDKLLRVKQIVLIQNTLQNLNLDAFCISSQTI
jgi:hypothetical protein